MQISLSVERNLAEYATEILQSSGALSVSIASANEQECFDVAAPGDPDWEYQRLRALFECKHPIGPITEALSMGLDRSPELLIENIDDKDWERSWLDNFKPIKVGKRLWVCPSWCTPVEKDEINLTIDPGRAFGTGTHETTQLCLAYLASTTLDQKTIIDLGCGSGILGIAGIKLGATSAIGIDIDPTAVQVSEHNAKINHVQKSFQVLSVEQFVLYDNNFKADLVIANILEKSIIALSAKIAEMVATGGTILLSGILEHQTDNVIQSFDRHFQFTRKTKNGWVLLIGRNLARGPGEDGNYG